jgi:hypothetical protein
MYDVGSLIAFQDENGHVYTGIVKSVEGDGDSYDVDVLADGTYRENQKAAL